MRLLITGTRGQLGTELTRQAGRHEIRAVDHDALDITDAPAVQQAFASFRPDAVINAAAWTAVDRAEEDVEAAFAVNRDGPANLAEACARAGIPLIHVSTDYVFDGRKEAPYDEQDEPAPIGVYGRSKLAGEEAVREACERHVILRTSWVFSAHRHNFVKTMLRLGAERKELGVVADQRGCPTAAAELARGILALLEQGSEAWGTYHFCQPEPTTWHGFAEAIFAEARRQGMALRIRQVDAIATSDYPTPAKRPANSELNCEKLESTFGITIRPWRESLKEVIKELKDG